MARWRGARRRGFPPARKSLGQHFLTDRAMLERIADALQLDRRRRRSSRSGPGAAR